MYESNSFSGLTEAQADIVKYWHFTRSAGDLPSRADIDPGVLRRHLSAISIVEIDHDGDVRFRIAGSELRSIFGREMRGRHLRQCAGPVADMWSLGLTAVLERGAPIGGIIERGDECHAWLRLPLKSPDTSGLVLCHDMVVPKSRLVSPDDCKSNTVSYSPHGLAA